VTRTELEAEPSSGTATVDMKFEVVVIPVSDVDRAKEFYGKLGWRLDADRASGDSFRSSYGSYTSFDDPDDNAWVLQEVTPRVPARIEPRATPFASVRRASTAHGEHEKRIGEADANWPEWLPTARLG
jgi:catechol 2,3-dioxygenase-like lactoylglutathione lyase family enzyme